MKKEDLIKVMKYLPYDVKVRDIINSVTWTLHPWKDCLDSLEDNEHLSLENYINENEENKADYGIHKLLLHPLSYLEKEIELNGKNVRLIDFFARPDMESIKLVLSDMSIDEGITCDLLPHYIIDQFNQWHIDWQGLIESGLAIDINSLKE